MKKITYLFAALAFMAVTTTGCIIVADDGDSDLTITNASDYTLIDIRVAPIGSVSWGPNLIAPDVLYPDESLIIELDCDTYDVLVEDDAGATCVLEGLDLCFDSAEWVVTNGQLNACF